MAPVEMKNYFGKLERHWPCRSRLVKQKNVVCHKLKKTSLTARLDRHYKSTNSHAVKYEQKYYETVNRWCSTANVV